MQAGNVRGKGRKCAEKEWTCREIVGNIQTQERRTDRVVEGDVKQRDVFVCAVHDDGQRAVTKADYKVFSDVESFQQLFKGRGKKNG